MSRLILSLVLIVLFAVPADAAKNIRDKYEDVTLPLLTDYMVRSKLLKIEQKEQYLDYLAITECPIYKTVKDSQFKQQNIQAAIQKKIEQPIPGDGVLYVRVPTIFYVSEYNFDTQSMTLAPESQMRRANILDLLTAPSPICDDLPTNRLKLPTIYNLRLSVPISFYRIPLKREIAEDVYPKMDTDITRNRNRILYGTIYMQIEPVPPQSDVIYGTTRTAVRGQVNMIDIYLDQDRKILLRNLNYDENY